MSVPPQEELPLSWSAKKVLHARDLLAFATWYIFVVIPFLGTAYVLDTMVFHFPLHAPIRGDHRVVIFFVLWCAIGVPLSLACQRLWLVVMSRVLRKDEVAPLISYGIPRRISRADAAILQRLYDRR